MVLTLLLLIFTCELYAIYDRYDNAKRAMTDAADLFVELAQTNKKLADLEDSSFSAYKDITDLLAPKRTLRTIKGPSTSPKQRTGRMRRA